MLVHIAAVLYDVVLIFEFPEKNILIMIALCQITNLHFPEFQESLCLTFDAR